MSFTTSQPQRLFWYDGQLVESNSLTLPIDHPALLYGASVFTTIRVYANDLHHPKTFWQAHIQRLKFSLDRFNWDFSHWQRLELGAAALLPFFPVLRLTIFPDGSELIQGSNLPADLSHSQQSGVVAQVMPPPPDTSGGTLTEKLTEISTEIFYDRSLANHKTGNYLAPWLALQFARRHGAKEAILTDPAGNWLETATGNLWGYDGHTWFTPSLSSPNGNLILPGITRAYLLAGLQRDGYSVQEAVWNLDLVKQLTMIAYSNSVVGIIPFRQIYLDKSQLTFAVTDADLSQLRSYFNE